MEATSTDIPEVPAQNAVPSKRHIKMNESIQLVGDGVKTLLQLFEEQVNITTGLDDVLATGKTTQMNIKLYLEAETADLV